MRKGKDGAPDTIRAQYEAYPYPARDPRDEKKRLIVGSPSWLDEVVHYLFAGRWEEARPFRALVAGGGTGDGLVMLAQHCADRGLAARIDYVDLSTGSRRIAEARVAARGLGGVVRFHTGSLLDLATLAPGPYDYIDCCGVLHHLPDPAAGLAALRDRLAPEGGMGLMVYGTHGRTGVYPLQSALRRLGDGLPDADRVALAKRLVASLPETNWFRRNAFLGDHRASDAGLYDLLLHSQDRAYTIPEIVEWVEGAGLEIVSFIDPARYDPTHYLGDPRLRGRLEGLGTLDRAALAEELSGAFKTHIFYVRHVGAEGRVASPGDPDMRPVLRGLDGPTMAKSLKPGQPITLRYDGLTARPSLPSAAPAMLALVDGERTLDDIRRLLAERRGEDLSWTAFHKDFAALYRALNGFGKLFLRR